jgi:YesN/AraC family two-component response regulator
MCAVQVVVADDDVLLREGLASLLDRSGFEVVGQAADAAELLALVREKRPELAIVDIRMPPTHTTEGLDAARVIRTESPDSGATKFRILMMALLLCCHAYVANSQSRPCARRCRRS